MILAFFLAGAQCDITPIFYGHRQIIGNNSSTLVQFLAGYYNDTLTVVCAEGFVTASSETSYNVTCDPDLMWNHPTYNVSSACQSKLL